MEDRDLEELLDMRIRDFLDVIVSLGEGVISEEERKKEEDGEKQNDGYQDAGKRGKEEKRGEGK